MKKRAEADKCGGYTGKTMKIAQKHPKRRKFSPWVGCCLFFAAPTLLLGLLAGGLPVFLVSLGLIWLVAKVLEPLMEG